MNQLDKNRRRKLTLLVVAVIAAVIILDQVVKILVKTSMYLGESIEVASWFKILFIENNGMAFGMELGPKLFLTLFRIVVVGLIIWYIFKLIKSGGSVKTGYLVCLSLITAGAAGNIIDCLFYGMIFNNPLPPEIAQLFPADGGYAPILQGKVVDMLYFPLFSFDWPAWMPFVGGDHFVFFQPVFNIADAAITCGMIAIILFYASQLVKPNQGKSAEDSDEKVEV